MPQRKQWRDLTTRQQTAIQFAAALQFALLAAALWDIWHRPVDEINGDRRLWTMASFVNFVGPLSYFLFGRKDCC
jgi:RsiW-degrading membrane proteinase PrsW (M82 family)